MQYEALEIVVRSIPAEPPEKVRVFGVLHVYPHFVQNRLLHCSVYLLQHDVLPKESKFIIDALQAEIPGQLALKAMMTVSDLLATEGWRREAEVRKATKGEKDE